MLDRISDPGRQLLSFLQIRPQASWEVFVRLNGRQRTKLCRVITDFQGCFVISMWAITAAGERELWLPFRLGALRRAAWSCYVSQAR